MGLNWPDDFSTERLDGDEPTSAPTKNDRSLLGTERGTDSARRLQVDSKRNLYTRDAIAGGNATVLNNGAITTVSSATLAPIVSYTAPSAKTVTRISASGSEYAKFRLVLNTSTIEYKRSGPDRNVEFGPFALASGDVLDVKVEHFATGETADFESTIWGV